MQMEESSKFLKSNTALEDFTPRRGEDTNVLTGNIKLIKGLTFQNLRAHF